MTYVLCTACLSKLKPPPGSGCLSIVPPLTACEACLKSPATSEFNGSLVDLMHQRHREKIEAGYKTYASIEYNGGESGARIQVLGVTLDEQAKDELAELNNKAMAIVQTSKCRNDPQLDQVLHRLRACFGQRAYP